MKKLSQIIEAGKKFAQNNERPMDAIKRLILDGSLGYKHFVYMNGFGPKSWNELLDFLGLEEVVTVVEKGSVQKPNELDRKVLRDMD